MCTELKTLPYNRLNKRIITTMRKYLVLKRLKTVISRNERKHEIGKRKLNSDIIRVLSI